MSLENKNNIDYRNTLLLPKTDLPMRASLPEKEPNLLEKWNKEKLFSKVREMSKAEKSLFYMMDRHTPMEIYTWVLL